MENLLIPTGDIKGASPHWIAVGDAPTFQIALDIPPDGGWLLLRWDASLTDSVFRPILVLESKDQTEEKIVSDILLSGTSFGSQHAIVHIPAGTRVIRLSPTDRPGTFGFRLKEARWVPAAAALMFGFRNQPVMALHALGAAMIGRLVDFRLLLTEAIQVRPLTGYSAWKAKCTRQPEWSGLDAPVTTAIPGFHFLWTGKPPNQPAAPVPDFVRLHHHVLTANDAKGVRDRLGIILREVPDGDLMIYLPANSVLLLEALPALAAEAARNPTIDFFYGDMEHVRPDGQVNIAFATGFDPLSTFKWLAANPGLALRVGTLRKWLEVAIPATGVVGIPLGRPWLRVPAFAPMSTYPEGLIDWMFEGWRGEQALSLPTLPRTTIVIPTRDRLDLLRACIESLALTIPDGTEIIVVDNDSCEEKTQVFLRNFALRPDCSVIHAGGVFNYSQLCNLGAKAAKGEMLVFLNNDTTILTEDWLRRLAEFAMHPRYGAVGARLLYPSGNVQHAGVVLGIGQYAGHIDLNLPGDADGSFGKARENHRVLAVTGACMAIERQKFEAVGGFDEINLPVDLNDIDLCLRLGEKEWSAVFVGEAELVHHESASRGKTGQKPRYLNEKAYFAHRWQHVRRADPYFHPALSLLLTRPHLG